MEITKLKKENIKLSVSEKEDKGDYLSVTMSKSYLNKLLWSTLMLKNSDSEMAERITGREKEILTQIAKGKDNEEIGNEMNISEHTVKSHIKNIFQKLEVSDRTIAVVKAIKYNLIDIYTI